MGETKKRKILIVDDEHINIALLDTYLKDSYETISAHGGREALKKVDEHDPDLVLLDIMMPDLNGYEVCEILKQSEKTRFIPVVMVTALSGPADRIKGINAGADDFLIKPLDRIEIITRVSSLLRIKRLHDELLKERDQANLYLDLAAVMLVVMDEKGTVKLLSKKGYEVLGHAEGELTGINWFDNCVPETSRELSRKTFMDFFSGEGVLEGYFESPVLTRDGKERIISWNNAVLMKDCGNENSLLICGADITERKEADEKIKRANEYLGNLLEASPIATISIDIEANITTANKNAASLLCMDLNDLPGRPIASFVEGDAFSVFKDIRDSEVTFVRGDGERVPMNVSTSLIKDNEGTMGLIVAMQELSKLRGLFITPLTEDAQDVAHDSQDGLEPGLIYLADCNRQEEGYLAFSKLVKQGKPGLCITRKNPEKIRLAYGLAKTPLVWLTRNKSTGQQTLDPSELFKIHPTIHDFIHKVSDGIILVDGLEYLLLGNDFISVVKLMEQTNDTVMASDSRLIVQIDPDTLEKKDFHLLKRWMKPLKVPEHASGKRS